MTVVFDAEPLLAFAFDEPGADVVERWLDRIYDGEIDGYATTVNLTEFRYVAVRKSSAERTDAHIDDLRDMGVAEYGVDGLWEAASELKATYSLSLGDAYAVAATRALDTETDDDVTLLVGADGDFDAFESDETFSYLIERFRDESA
jgi:predicted nucleic acid-binding protein